MPNGVPRLALWALVVLVLVATLVPVPGARAANPSNYALNGRVTAAGNVPVPGGVTVDLISGATHQVYTTTTAPGGSFAFTNAGTSGALLPGSWGLWVPPQGNRTLAPGSGCNPDPCAFLPNANAPSYVYETAQNLSSTSSVHTVGGVSILQYNATLYGNATKGTTKIGGASVELLAPSYNAFVLVNNTTRPAGNFSLKVPWGTWVLRTTLPGFPDQFDYQQVTVAATTLTVNPVISKFLTYGTVYQAASPTSEVQYGGNASVFDRANGYLYTTPTLNGGFYDVGTYPSGFSGVGANSFDVVLQTIGYQTVWYPLTVSGGSPNGGPLPHDVWAASQYAPAVYQTNLTYSTGFKWLNTSTSATLSNDSTFPELANASIGQLWAQLALDWQGNLSFNSANLATVENWINASGPFFPAGAAQAKVGNLSYNESLGGTFSASSGCSTGYCGLTSPAGLSYSWAKDYSLNGSAAANLSAYTVSFNFRHPTNYQAINYTITLPTGYALQAGQATPPGAKLLPGPGGTWTTFTLSAQPYVTPSSTATLTFVKYGKVTANVAASSSDFAFSTRNVLNGSHGNYSVIVGVGQNISFSAAGSTFPAGVNGSKYVWNWGDASPTTTTTKVVSYHTYAAVGEKNGTLNLTSSGGTTANVSFHVYVGNGGITGKIVSNATTNQTKTVGSGNASTTYLLVNSSTSLRFNATGFTSSLYPNGPAGVLSVAYWNASHGPMNQTGNFTAGASDFVGQNFTITFNPTGDNQYLTSATIGGAPVSFLGWQYNVTLKLWDAIGKYTSQTLIVLVQDSQKPNSVATVQNSAGTNITSSGVVEGPNHLATVKLVSSYATDPNGGSLTTYHWNITNANSSANWNMTFQNRSGFRAPLPYSVDLQPQTKPYTVNLTVTDRAGNTAYNTASITVAVNTTLRPVLAVGNLSAPSSMDDGTSYTIWVNVTNTLGTNSTALGVQVGFYLLPPSGSGSPTYIGGSPGSTTFYGYDTAGVVNRTIGTGTVSLKYNETVRAQISFNPGLQGTYELWANATATNEFAGDYATGGNAAHVTVTLNPNPTQRLYLEIGIVVAVIAAVIIIVLAYRQGWLKRRGSGSRTASGRSGLERGAKKDKPDVKPAAEEEDE